MGRSFEAAFEAEFAPLHRYLARRLGASVADELAAETFAVAFRRWDRLDPERPVRPWLYGIAANLVRHHWRKERRMLRAYARTGVDPVLAEEDDTVERADADSRQPSAELYGGVLSVKLAASNPPATVIGGFEARILANVVDEDLRAAGLSEIDAVQSKGDGGAVYGEGVSLPTAAPPLPGGACEVAPGAVPAHSTVLSARVVPLLGGFCAFELETSDPTAFGAAAPVTVSKLPEMTSRRPHLIEVYDDTKRLQIIQWSSPFTGAEPGDSGPLGNGEGGSWAHPPLCDPFASGGPGVCG